MAERPLASIVTANYNGAAFLPAAAGAVLAQTLGDFEWIVADDASTDDSGAVIAQVTGGDPRVRFLTAERNGGPACARNRALAAARGQWIAVFDSDDEMAPDRLERLVARGLVEGADIVVDNLTLFTDPPDGPERLFLSGRAWAAPRVISLADYIESGRMYARRPGLGYLKPLFRAEALGDLRYREDLRIGEDYDLVVRLLAQGARMRLEPAALYRYRRHGASISSVLGPGEIEQMIAADGELGIESSPGAWTLRARRAQARRRRSLQAALAYDRVIQTLKQRRLLVGIRMGLLRPYIWPLLTMPLMVRAKRLAARLSGRRASAAVA
ncbi:MAG TPA: glycosyltransferase [Phenylobacterium sp.]|nr:glycosyltransferase [Phenylobacterium sp.]